FRDRLAVAVSSPLLGGQRGAFRLYDMTGRLVREERVVLGVNEMETGDLPPGMYFWSVEAKGEVVKGGKIVKMEK
ncbi:MAG: T9SS type A sorting domain-containing protein, partial [Saprospiraceae bacterium]|nr:T9SS type A sorting domain-containing protein [Saprospiraceae bacterium]